MKKIGIQNNNKILMDALVSYFVNRNIEVCGFENLSDINAAEFDLIVLYDYCSAPASMEEGKCYNVHPSLLPAFEGKNSIEEAYKSGVKISGITVTDLVSGRIIAQYPVIIRNLMHYDEYKNEIYKAVCIFVPVVIEAILENKVFELEKLLSGGACGGCGKCSKGGSI